MIPALANIKFVRGDSYSKFGRVRTKTWDAVTGTYVAGPYRNLTGWTGLAQVRTSVDSSTILFSFDVVLGNQETTPGSFFIRAQPEDTENLTVLEGVWDLQWTTSQGEILTYASGEVELIPDVSHEVAP